MKNITYIKVKEGIYKGATGYIRADKIKRVTKCHLWQNGEYLVKQIPYELLEVI